MFVFSIRLVIFNKILPSRHLSKRSCIIYQLISQYVIMSWIYVVTPLTEEVQKDSHLNLDINAVSIVAVI